MGLTTPKSVIFFIFFWRIRMPTSPFCRKELYVHQHCLGHCRICAKSKLTLFDLGSGNSPLSIGMHGPKRRAHKTEKWSCVGYILQWLTLFDLTCKYMWKNILTMTFSTLRFVWFHVRQRNISLSTSWKSLQPWGQWYNKLGSYWDDLPNVQQLRNIERWYPAHGSKCIPNGRWRTTASSGTSGD